MTHPLVLWFDRVVGGKGQETASDDHRAFIQAHRLEPLAGKYLECSDAWAMAYTQTLLRGMRMVGEASRLDRLLREHGLHPVWTRGALYGASLYGDPGVRPATDLDVYVSQEELGAAETLFAEQGYRLFSHRYPRWYFRRYHLQFPLRHSETGLLVDLHWAADHPLSDKCLSIADIGQRSRLRSVDGQAWHEPSPEDHLLLACAHLAKESSVWLSNLSVDPSLSGDAPGRFLAWLDLLLLLHRDHAELDWLLVEERARAWSILSEVGLILGRIRSLVSESETWRAVDWPAFAPPASVAHSMDSAMGVEEGDSIWLGVRKSRVHEWARALGRGKMPVTRALGQMVRFTETAAATALCCSYDRAKRVIS